MVIGTVSGLSEYSQDMLMLLMEIKAEDEIPTFQLWTHVYNEQKEITSYVSHSLSMEQMIDLKSILELGIMFGEGLLDSLCDAESRQSCG
jgi:hypothetical protein